MPMNISRLAFGISCVVVVNLMTFGVRGADILRIVHSFSEHSLLHSRLTKLVPEVEAAADFVVRFEVSAATELGGTRDILYAISRGHHDFVLAPANVLAANRIDVGPLRRADIFQSYEQWLRFPGSQAEDEVASVLHNSEFNLVASTWLASQRLISTKSIRTVSDLRGLKLRVSAVDKGVATAFQALGAKTVNIGRSELYGALKAGVVDGTVQPLAWTNTRRFFDFRGTIVKNPVGGRVGLLVGKDNWQTKLDSYTIDRVKGVLSRAMLGLGGRLEALDNEKLRELQRRGIRVAEFNDAEMRIFRDAVRSDWYNSLSARDQRIADLISRL